MENGDKGRSRKYSLAAPGGMVLSGIALLAIGGFLAFSLIGLARKETFLDSRLKDGSRILEILGAADTTFKLLITNNPEGRSRPLLSGWSSQVEGEFRSLDRIPFPWTRPEKILLHQQLAAWHRLFGSYERPEGNPETPFIAHTLILTNRSLLRSIGRTIRQAQEKHRTLVRKMDRTETGIVGSGLLSLLLFTLSVLLVKKTSKSLLAEERISESLRRKTALCEALLNINRILQEAGMEEREKVFRTTLDELSRSLRLPYAFIGIIPPGEAKGQILARTGPLEDFQGDIPFSIDPDIPEGQGLAGRAIRTGEPQITTDLPSDPGFSIWRDHTSRFGLRSAIADSSRTRDGEILVLLILSREADFPPDIVRLLSRLVRDLAAFLDRQSVQVERNSLAASQEAIREIQQELLSAKTPRTMYESLVRTILLNTDLIGAQVQVPDPETEWFSMVASAGKTRSLEEAAEKLRASRNPDSPVYGQTTASRAFREKKTIGPADWTTPPVLKKLREENPALLEIGSVMSFPIMTPASGEPSAILTVWSGLLPHFTPGLTRLLVQLTQSLGLALEGFDRNLQVESLSMIAQTTTDGVLILDKEGAILWVNRTFEKKWGYLLPEIRGRFPADFRAGPLTDEETLHRIRSHIRNHRSFEETVIRYSRNGFPFWIHINATVLGSREGPESGYVAIETDVTALKESEERSRITSLLYQAIAEESMILGPPSGKSPEEKLSVLLPYLAEHLGSPLLVLCSLPAGKDGAECLARGGADSGKSAEVLPGSLSGRAVRRMLEKENSRILPLPEPSSRTPSRGETRRGAAGGGMIASALRVGGERIALWGRFPGRKFLRREFLPLFEKIVDNIAGFMDQSERIRITRRERYRAVHLAVQRKILSAETEEELYRTLSEMISSEPGVLATDILIPGETHFERVALMGPQSDLLASFPTPPLHPSGPESPRSLPTLLFEARTPLRFDKPGTLPGMTRLWTVPPFDTAEIAAGWPIPGPSPDSSPLAVVTVIGGSAESFSDNIVFDLMQDLTESASVALERIRSLQKMKDLSLHDPLTGLLNRRGLATQLPSFLKGVDRHSGLGIIGVIDLDDFKPVNDTWGHATGDRLLIEIGHRMTGLLRENDLVCRLGGDEFAIAMELSGPENLSPVLERMHRTLTAPYFPEDGPGKGIRIGLSMGLIGYPGALSGNRTGENPGPTGPRAGERDPDTLLRLADGALYEIKRQKGNRSRWWNFSRGV